MSIPDPAIAERLKSTSAALQSVLGAIIDGEKRRAPTRSPLELLREITTSAEWAWLQPLYALIADIDQALADTEPLPTSEVAAVGAHARSLLSGGTSSAERAFIDRYQPLIQADPAVAIAHSQALRTIRTLPPEAVGEAERLHAHHQWNERRVHLRTAGRTTLRRTRPNDSD